MVKETGDELGLLDKGMIGCAGTQAVGKCKGCAGTQSVGKGKGKFVDVDIGTSVVIRPGLAVDGPVDTWLGSTYELGMTCGLCEHV